MSQKFINYNPEVQIPLPTQGWSQFLASRDKMLNSFDRAIKYSKSHKVETYHERVAEASFRRWLLNFLPKRYSVTSGYILSQGACDLEKTPHFDVIIYDQLESPILWIENNPDNSEQGYSLGIPAEYVKCVIEIKSAFNSQTVNKAIEHLKELQPLLIQEDPPNERYKKYLPHDFFCYTIFYELRDENLKDIIALNNIVNGVLLRGFSGGLILRSKGHKQDITGQISIFYSEEEIPQLFDPNTMTLLNGMPISTCLKIKDNLFFNSMLLWSEMYFSKFAFDLIAKLNGTFEIGKVSSYHGFGTSVWSEAVKQFQKQNNV